jgi:hypothetical protein
LTVVIGLFERRVWANVEALREAGLPVINVVLARADTSGSVWLLGWPTGRDGTAPARGFGVKTI